MKFLNFKRFQTLVVFVFKIYNKICLLKVFVITKCVFNVSNKFCKVKTFYNVPFVGRINGFKLMMKLISFYLYVGYGVDYLCEF